MEQMIHTTKGLISSKDLRVLDRIESGENFRKISTEWYHGEDLVRKDVAVSMLRPVEAGAKEGKLNGE